MEIKVQKNDNDTYLLELSGSLDLYSSNQLKDLFMKIIESRIERIIISLKDVDSINSSGIGALIYISSTTRKLNCPLIVIIPEGPILQVLEAARLKHYFTIVPSMKEAMALAAAGDNAAGT